MRVLRDMVGRNLALPHRFVCLTDAPIEGIDCEPLPEGLVGWWAKLWLFERFKAGRVLYLDLDTVVTGPLEPFAAYAGAFALLRDFYHPLHYGSGMMLWNGDHSRIWHEWERAGRPMPGGGDQVWIEHVVRPQAEAIQDAFPGLVCSYKVDAQEWPPAGVSVVCFHGNPRPHACLSDWVAEVWKVGGLARPRFIQGLNTPIETMLEQARTNFARDLPVFVEQPANHGAALLVAGGPSLAECLPRLRMRRERGGHVFAMNGSHDWLMARGIVPDFCLLLDAREANAEFVRRWAPGCTYLVAAQCHPRVFEVLDGADVVIWGAWAPGMTAVADRVNKPVTLVAGGNTVGLKAINLAYLWGYREMHLFGYDSSYRGEANHAYAQPLNDGEARLDITAAGKTFHCARWMARQALDFQATWREMVMERGVKLKVHGDGLIPWIAHNMEEQHDGLRKRRELSAGPARAAG